VGSKGVEGEALSSAREASASLSTWKAEKPTARARLKGAAYWIAEHELWLLGVVVSLLILRTSLPNFLPASAIVSIPVFWLCRKVAKGHLTVRTPLDIPILSLLVLIPISLYASVDLGSSLPIVYKIIVEVAIFYGIVNSVRSLKQAQLLSVLLVIASGGISVLGLVATRWSATKVFSLPQVYKQLPSVIILQLNKAGFHPNIVGGTLAMLLPVNLSVFLSSSKRASKLVLTPLLLVMGITISLTQSRGAWVGLGIGLLLMAIWHNRWFLLGIPTTVAALLLSLRHFGAQQVADFLLLTQSTSSAAGRMELWQRGIYMIQDFPYTGIGLGTFSHVAPVLYPFFLISPDADIPHAHNILLQIAIDLGIPGLIAFVAVLTSLFFLLYKAVQLAEDNHSKSLAIGLFCGLIVYLVHGLFDSITAMSIKVGPIVWILMGLAAGLWLSLKASKRRGD
jgi:putative inorganic carbon (HCO3(-)) transporter